MRIGFVHNREDIYCATRMRYFINKGHSVYSLSFFSKNPQKLQKNIYQIPLIYFPFKYSYLKRFIHLIEIIYYVNKYKIDVLHIISIINGIYSICSIKTKIVLENMGSDVLILPKVHPIYKKFYKIIYKLSDAVIQDSHVSKKAGILYGAPLQNNKVIDVGIDMKLFNSKIKYGKARKYLGISQNEKMIFISRGTGEIYNIDVIIKTISIVKKYYNNIKYVFCDMRGDFYRKFIDLILDNDCFDNVIIAGKLNHNNQLPYFYTDSNIVLSVPSSDSSPFSVYESMACKTPVIISELPWYHKKFQKDIDMVVVPSRNVKILSDSIIKILNGQTVINLNSAYNKVSKNINFEIENFKLEKLYYKILDIRN